MLSNKWTFSLKVLVLFLTVGFMATSAMADEFDVSLDKTNDVSTATDDLELVHPGDGGKIALTVEFAKAVILAKESVQIITIDKDGKLLSLQKFPAAAETAANASRTKSFMPVVEGGAATVKLFIAAGIASVDPFNADRSKKLEATIHLIGRDDGAPTVYSIERAVDDDHAFAKISPKTDPTIEVRITLSELPKEFTTDHISATEATVTSVRQLLTVGGEHVYDFLTGDDVPENLPRLRMPHDEDMSGVTVIPDGTDGANDDVYIAAAPTATPPTPTTLVGLNTDAGALNGTTVDAADLRARKVAARETYGGIHRAINDAGILGTAYKYKEVPALDAANLAIITAEEAATMDLNPKAADKTFGVDYILANYEGQAGTMAAPKAPGAAVAKPEVPDPREYTIPATYTAAVQRYADDFAKYRTYANAKMLYDAYRMALDNEHQMDVDARGDVFFDPARTHIEPEDRVRFATGTDQMLYPYLVTITPKYANTNNVVVKVKEFEDRTRPTSMKYIPPSLESDYTEGVDKLTILVAEAKVGTPLGAGLEVVIPKEKRIPASGHLVLATNVAGSGIKKPAGSDKDEPKPAERTPAQLLYNVVELGLPNLQTFLANGGTIALVAPAGLYISEIMWGSDASLVPSNNSQWIEISNSGAASVLTGDKTHKLIFYGLNETPITTGVVDTVGTAGTGGFWSITGKGQSGRTGVGEKAADVVAVVPTLELISMQRTMNADGTPADGTLEGNWVQSKGPGVNFDLSQVGTRIGSPGAPIDAAKYPATPTPDTPAPTVPAAAAADVMITEIMVDTGNGRSPQWIELTYSGMAKATLDGWEMVIDNAIDADVLGGGNAITVSLGGVTVDVSKHTGNTGKGHSVLVTAWPATRKSANISDDRVINLATQLNQVSRYQLLSYSGFRITLVPPRTGATISSFGDIAGNLHEDWEIPMSEGAARSSIIRREMVAGAATMGTDAAGWMLADSTSLTTGQPSFYGNDEDAGTPGHDSGGPLPVELSHFRPARDKTTGAAVITWSTQSELNNAGFFIKRSQQRNGQFKVINATMIPGAGTTSEKQFYTFTDTTAQPNVVYYYQIEDVSLDGNRQTLTLGTRLKGHIGAAGKATITWGELKEVK